MAVTLRQEPGAASGPELRDWFVMRLGWGWDEIPPEAGGRSPCAGDVMFLIVIRPQSGVTGPPGWMRADDPSGCAVFWKTLGPNEPDPAFRSAEPCEWAVKGYAVSGIDGPAL